MDSLPLGHQGRPQWLPLVRSFLQELPPTPGLYHCSHLFSIWGKLRLAPPAPSSGHRGDAPFLCCCLWSLRTLVSTLWWTLVSTLWCGPGTQSHTDSGFRGAVSQNGGWAVPWGRTGFSESSTPDGPLKKTHSCLTVREISLERDLTTAPNTKTASQQERLTQSLHNKCLFPASTALCSLTNLGLVLC